MTFQRRAFDLINRLVRRRVAGRHPGVRGARPRAPPLGGSAAVSGGGHLAVLGVYTLRQDFAGGTDTAALATTASGLVAVKDWSFLLGPGIMPAVNALCFATIMYRSGLVPRWIPTFGLIGAPLLLASSTASLFGAWEQVSSISLLMALPIATWELSVGVYMTVKGFRTPPATDADANVVPAPAATLAHA